MSQPLALTHTPLRNSPRYASRAESIHPSKSTTADAAFLAPDSSPAQSETDYVHQHYTGLFPAFSLSLIAMGMKVALFQHTERSDD